MLERCPVCLHEQDFGFECENCGTAMNPLGHLSAPPLPSQKAEGLEAHHYQSTTAVVERDSAFESSAYAPVDRVTVSPPDAFESTHAAATEAGQVAPLELEASRYQDAPTPPVPASTRYPCRYCKHLQLTGALCERCGAFLPRRLTTSGTGQDDSIRCKACGSPATPGSKCAECGHVNPNIAGSSDRDSRA